jgi:hypothetical protein
MFKISYKYKKIIKANFAKIFPYIYAKYYYRTRTGKSLDYNDVHDLNEKLFWIERYWKHPLLKKCSDKYCVREYVEKSGYGSFLNQIYGVYDQPNEIHFESLPNQFVLKCNHGGDFNIFCEDKKEINIAEVKKILSKWLKIDYGLDTAEYHYFGIKPLIMAEKLLQPTKKELLEYQLFFINGNPEFILARNDLSHKGVENNIVVSYTLNWERISLRKQGDDDLTLGFNKPKDFKKMIECATKLAKPFPHVRVDFYDVDDKLVFGELTFSSSGNVLSNYKDEVIVDMGLKLTLPLPT